MEVGIGHHGEPGIEVLPLESAADMAKRMCSLILGDIEIGEGDDAVVLVSGLGATPLMELYVLYGEVQKILSGKGIRIHDALVGNYFTSLEMMGVTLSIMKLDQDLAALYDKPCYSVGMRKR